MTAKLTLLFGTLLAAGAVVATLVAFGGSSSQPRDRSHTPPKAMRSLVVYRGTMPAASAPGTVMHALLRSGRAPARPVVGTVITDTDCGADATGLSRCRNVIRMPGGHRTVVRHPHRMMDVPCMTPGERVRVTSA